MRNLLGNRLYPVTLKQSEHNINDYSLTITFSKEELIEFIGPYIHRFGLIEELWIKGETKRLEEKLNNLSRSDRYREKMIELGQRVWEEKEWAIFDGYPAKEAWKKAAEATDLALPVAQFFGSKYKKHLENSQRREIYRLKKFGYSEKRIAEETGIELKKVSKIIEERHARKRREKSLSQKGEQK